jgi:hypothetical protein
MLTKEKVGKGLNMEESLLHMLSQHDKKREPATKSILKVDHKLWRKHDKTHLNQDSSKS